MNDSLEKKNDLFVQQEAKQIEIEKNVLAEMSRSKGVSRGLKTELEIAPGEGRSTEGILARLEECSLSMARARTVYNSIPGSINNIRKNRVKFVNETNDKERKDRLDNLPKKVDKLGRTAIRDAASLIEEIAQEIAFLRYRENLIPEDEGLGHIYSSIPVIINEYLWKLVNKNQKRFEDDHTIRPPSRAVFVPYVQVSEREILLTRKAEVEHLISSALSTLSSLGRGPSITKDSHESDKDFMERLDAARPAWEKDKAEFTERLETLYAASRELQERLKEEK